MKQYFGKYRGQVATNLDPMMQGRIQIKCPAVLGDGQLSWAMPCMPMAGSQMGFYALPIADSNIWVEFEGGDPNKPIWSGCFWGVGEFPVGPPAPPGMSVVFLKTKSCTLTLSDLPGVGGISLEYNSSMKVSMSVTGIEIDNGQGAVVTLGPGPKVTVNNGALEVV